VTIAVLVKVNDGFVLATDSATTLSTPGPDGMFEASNIQNIYNNANKLFNLRKGLPIAAMTWGLGNIGPASIATLMKDLRRRFSGLDRGHLDWKLDPESYDMDEVAARVRAFFYDEHYASLSSPSFLGLLVGGYSAGSQHPKIFTYGLEAGGCSGPDLLADGDASLASWWGQPEAITRVLLGVSLSLPQALVNLGVPEADAPQYAGAIQSQVQEHLVQSAMPIQDAIELAEWLVDLTIKFVRFSPGHPTVGGPVEVAAITQHERFKWVARKHYFSTRLNPTEEGM
jgi:hypothetical protein